MGSLGFFSSFFYKDSLNALKHLFKGKFLCAPFIFPRSQWQFFPGGGRMSSPCRQNDISINPPPWPHHRGPRSHSQSCRRGAEVIYLEEGYSKSQFFFCAQRYLVFSPADPRPDRSFKEEYSFRPEGGGWGYVWQIIVCPAFRKWRSFLHVPP